MNAYTVVTKLIDKMKGEGGLAEELQTKVDVLFLLDRISNDEYLSLCDKQGYKLHRIDDHTVELVPDEEHVEPIGTYLNPFPYEDGMTVARGLFYAKDGFIWEAAKDGLAEGFDSAPNEWWQ